MWQRFTDSAKKVVFYAQQEAERVNVSFVDTEHLLLGFLRDSKGAAVVWPPPPSTHVDSANMAAYLLRSLSLNREALWQEVTRRMTTNEEPRADGDMKLAAGGKKVIDKAYEEARYLNSSYIGTEHLLLGLIHEESGLAGQVLAEQGVTLKRARQEVMRLQGGPPPAPDATPKRPWWHFFRP